MRITSLWIKRPILNRISYWLYKKYCNEPFVPDGDINIVVKKSSVRITFLPRKFVQGIHEWYIFKNITKVDYD